MCKGWEVAAEFIKEYLNNAAYKRSGTDCVKIMVDYRACVMELKALAEQYEKLLFLGSPTANTSVQLSAANAHTNDQENARIQAQDGVLEMIEKVKSDRIDRINCFETVLNCVEDWRKEDYITVLLWLRVFGF